jgi:hypothetical protein
LSGPINLEDILQLILFLTSVQEVEHASGDDVGDGELVVAAAVVDVVAAVVCLGSG